MLSTELAANLVPPFVGDNAPTSRLTVQAAWWLNPTTGTVGLADPTELPYRWFIDQGHTGQPDGITRPLWETEIEIPIDNIKQVVYTDQISQDAPTLTVQLYNINTTAYSQGPTANAFGDPGALSFTYASTSLNQSLWNQQTTNPLYQLAYLLRENALIRWYFGYGGRSFPSYTDALAANVMLLKGPFLVDQVSIESNTGLITLTCRGAVGKMMLDQNLYPPVVPVSQYTSSGIQFYPPMAIPYAGVPNYGSPTAADAHTSVVNPSIKLSIMGACLAASGLAYAMVGTDGAVYAYSDVLFGYGGIANLGDESTDVLPAPIIGIEATDDGLGYWLCGQDGQIYAFGSASGAVSLYDPVIDGGWGLGNYLTSASITATSNPPLNTSGFVLITKGVNDTINYTVNGGSTETVTIPGGEYTINEAGAINNLQSTLNSLMTDLNVTTSTVDLVPGDPVMIFTFATQTVGAYSSLQINGGNACATLGFTTPTAKVSGTSSFTAPIVAFHVNGAETGAWFMDNTGRIYNIGDTTWYGDMTEYEPPFENAIDFSCTPDHQGYVILTQNQGSPNQGYLHRSETLRPRHKPGPESDC